VLRSLIRSVSEAGLKCVKRVDAILRRTSLGLKLRLARAESAEELYEQLPTTIGSITKSAKSVKHVPEFVDTKLIESLTRG
jgi:hypothetical protein